MKTSMLFGFGKTSQLMILVLSLVILCGLLVTLICFIRCRRDRSSYVLDPDMVMPIGKPPEKEFYV